MKRDIDLIRKILETVELKEFGLGVNLEIPGYDLNTIAFNMELLVEAGYLKANISQASDGQYVMAWPDRLTWDGYEFLDLTRNDTIWQKSKAIIKDKSLGASFTILIELLKFLTKNALGTQ